MKVKIDNVCCECSLAWHEKRDTTLHYTHTHTHTLMKKEMKKEVKNEEQTDGHTIQCHCVNTLLYKTNHTSKLSVKSVSQSVSQSCEEGVDVSHAAAVLFWRCCQDLESVVAGLQHSCRDRDRQRQQENDRKCDMSQSALHVAQAPTGKG